MSWNWIEKANELRDKRIEFVMATIVKVIGSSPRDVGAKIIIENGNNHHFHGTIGGGALEKQVIEHAVELFKTGGNKTEIFALDESAGQACGGKSEVYFETISTLTDLYLFGAGHVAQAICRTLEGTPFKVHLIDEREEWVLSDKVSSSVIRHHMMWDKFIETARWNKDNTYAAIMTYDHTHDYGILESIIDRDLKYLGAIGSKNKWAKFQGQLKEKGISEKQISNVHCPIGIKVGGKSPSEVAISIAAELLQTYHGKI